ncbi:MAG TPA: DUF2061 domain-containing protein [Longimicrobiales bacterium]|nr:DUF2061 domain-containing protein [Longimicrobiales bacterium]
MSETRARSAVKSLSWRVVATATTVALVLAFTGELRIAVAVGGIEVVAKLVIFYAHERVWDRVRWGEQRP